MKYFILLFLPFGLFSQTALERLVGDSTLFKLDEEAFQKKYFNTLKVRWTGSNKLSARGVTRTAFMKVGVQELLVSFSKKKISEVLMYFYTRGDHGDLTKELFKDAETKIAKVIQEHLGKAGRVFRSKTGRTTYEWIKQKKRFQLIFKHSNHEYRGKKKFRAEYIRMTIELDGIEKKRQKYGDLKKNVKRTKDGNTFIQNIPMVNQGKKGYCACATTARILQYYGRKGDQHDIADITATSSKYGTSVPELYKTLKKIGPELKLFVKEVKVVSLFASDDIAKIVKDYNRIAKSEKMSPIGGSNSIKGLLDSMDKKLLVKAKVQFNNRDFILFRNQIMSYIRNGVPITWAVMLGIVEEGIVLPQGYGGHMRLITGYNKKKEELIYSDTWGEKHEFKTMSFKDAYAITGGLYIVKPRKK